MQTGAPHLLPLQPASQPASHCCCPSHLPSSHCTWLRPHSHPSPTLGPWPVQSYLSSCPRVCQARHRQRGPNMLSEHVFSSLLSPSNCFCHRPIANSLEGRLLSSVLLQPLYSASGPPPSLNVCPPVTSLCCFALHQ